MWIKKLKIKKDSREFFVLTLGLMVVIFLFFGWQFGQKWWEISKKMPAGFPLDLKEKIGQENIPELEKEISKSLESKTKEEKSFYKEKAQKGEGLTHLARRALKNYLKDHSQNFDLKLEHKIYIEDYLAKKMGGHWLKLGEEVEFSSDLIKEAIEKAGKLTERQLNNLTQYSQLVPSLNY